ncbi:hypothetical protein Q9Q94_06000 [Uliginosibacterium sp. 31-16]|uniref:hypothetical protein n=1 Tax=Uliginosibacterium sp. 31-16 TaxID=3068315 RepID=UPI00273D6F53|nr:hypothetical protein [Uliginosibacterium sp. 31-16]MDP5239074.1 hypothetical protein [Uliginosibacterium sp. 31-16]
MSMLEWLGELRGADIAWLVPVLFVAPLLVGLWFRKPRSFRAKPQINAWLTEQGLSTAGFYNYYHGQPFTQGEDAAVAIGVAQRADGSRCGFVVEVSPHVPPLSHILQAETGKARDKLFRLSVSCAQDLLTVASDWDQARSAIAREAGLVAKWRTRGSDLV